MALTREERKLLHQKSNQPTLGSGVPDLREGKDGDVTYRNVKGSGVVQYLKSNNDWVAISSSGEMPQTRTPDSNRGSALGVSNSHGTLTGLDEDHHTQYLLVSGTRAMTGNLDMGTNNIGSVGTLDVNGHTTLDQVTINTTDGAFAVSGANPITLTTSGTNDIDITSARTLDVGVTSDYELTVNGNSNWDTTTVDWDNSSTFILTSLGNITIETDGTDGDSSGNDDSANTILIKNENTNASAFTGIHIKTNGQNAGSCYNGILIECDGVAAKGASYGIDLRSENNIIIRGEDANGNNSHPSTMKICSTGNIDIGAGFESSEIAIGSTQTRTQIHGVFETSNLWRLSDANIIMDRGTATGNDPTGVYTKFEAIDTYHLVRAMTYRTSTTVAWETDTTCHVASGSSTVTHDANTRILKGQKVTGTGIPVNTFVGDGGTPSDFTSTQFILENSSGVSVNASSGDNSEITLQFFNTSAIEEDNSIGIVNKDNDDNALGTVWQITVYYKCSSTKKNLQIFYLYFTSSTSFDKYTAVEDLHGSSAAGVLNWDSNQGITWQNEDTSDATVRASALRIQSGTNDF